MTPSNDVPLPNEYQTFLDAFALNQVIQSDRVGFPRAFYKMLDKDASAALILDRIIYWHGASEKDGKTRLRVRSSSELWLVKNYSEWDNECCVNASTARKALDRLEKRGIITTKLGKFNGVNSVYIRLNAVSFYEHLSKVDTLVSVQSGHMTPVVSVQSGHSHIQVVTKEQVDTKESKTLVAPTETTVEITPIEPTKTKPKRQSSSTPKSKKEDTPPAVLVNMTNEQLGRPRPAEYNDETSGVWGEQKPYWSLFASWEAWNKTYGWRDRSFATYSAHAKGNAMGKLVARVQGLGHLLDTFANDPNNPPMTYELLRDFSAWYRAHVWHSTPEDEIKYPTSDDAFETNFSNYLTFIAEMEPA